MRQGVIAGSLALLAAAMVAGLLFMTDRHADVAEGVTWKRSTIADLSAPACPQRVEFFHPR